MRYSVFNREPLAVYLSIWHFWHFLKACPFTIYMDHKPLVQALVKQSQKRLEIEMLHYTL